MTDYRSLPNKRKPMSEELKLNDRLAIDRTRLAAERSLMAWIRTALSMIAFGFTIYKFLQALHAAKPGPGAAAQRPAQRGAVAGRHRHFRRRGRLYSTLEIHQEAEPRSTPTALGPGVHRGDPDWSARPPDLREHGLHCPARSVDARRNPHMQQREAHGVDQRQFKR